MKINKKQVALNVLVTFVEGFLAAWLLTNNELTQHALVGAAAAGISAVWNLVIKPLLLQKNVLTGVK